MSFELIATDKETQARRGRYHTAHGSFETPVYMPVGTQATVKATRPDELVRLGAEIILGNTYHLFLRPGHKVIEKLGGLHRFMNWQGPILTDSGGYQVFSLAHRCKVRTGGVEFQSHLDGANHFLTPQLAIEIQESLDSDIMMVLDECLPYPSERSEVKKSLELTVRWAGESFDARKDRKRRLFAIVQGAMEHDLRLECLKRLVDLSRDFDGWAIGGVSVGEPMELGYEVIGNLSPHLPRDKPRYAMGIGLPEDIVTCIGLGVDMFDCVIPTRSARHGLLFTPNGRLYIRQARYAEDARPPQEDCRCYTCQNYSRAYLRHLSLAKEILSAILNTIHNLHYFFTLISEARQAIEAGNYAGFQREFFSRLHGADS